MKKFLIRSVLLALSCTAIVGTVFATENTDNWEALYYESSSANFSSRSQVVSDEFDLLDGSQVNFSQTVQLHELNYDTITEEAIDDFANAIKSGTMMADLITATDTYFATASGPETVILTKNGNEFKTQAVLTEDDGDSFVLDSTTVGTQLSAKNMTPTVNTIVKCVGVPAMGTGILFAEGDIEYIMFTVSRFENLMESNTVYTVEELANIMAQNKATIALPDFVY